MRNKRNLLGWIIRAYKRFLNLPVSVVLAASWIVGVALVSFSILALYLFWLFLKGVAGG